MEEIKNKLKELGYDVVYHPSANTIQFTPEHLEKRKEGKYWVTDIPKKSISYIHIEEQDIIKLTYFPIGIIDVVKEFSSIEELIDFVTDKFPLNNP